MSSCTGVGDLECFNLGWDGQDRVEFSRIAGHGRKGSGLCCPERNVVPWGHHTWDRLMQIPSNLCLPRPINWSCGEPQIPSAASHWV